MSIIYRASELGLNLRELVAGRLGFDRAPISPDLQQLFDEGNLHEEAVLKDLAKRGWEISHSQADMNNIGDYQHEVDLQITSEIMVRGHVDGLAIEPSRCVLEIKSMGDSSYQAVQGRGWDTPGLIQKYKWQVSVYMLATGLPLVLWYKNRNNGKSDTLGAAVPFYSKAQIAGRVLEAEAWARRGQLPPCDVTSFPCPYYSLCDKVDTREVLGDEALEQVAVEYKRTKAELAGIENQAKPVKERLDKLRKQLESVREGKTESGKYKAGKARITWTYMDNPVASLDKEAVKQAGIDLEPFMKKGKHWRLTVNVDD